MTRNTRCISPGDPVYVAARVMRDEDVGFLPVCDVEQHVVGVLTDRDITVRAVAAGNVSRTVGDVMTNEVVSCSPEEDVRDAERKMQAAQTCRVVCCDREGRLLGVISLSDVARLDDELHVAGTLRQVKEPTAFSL